jgi:hypothetical protein
MYSLTCSLLIIIMCFVAFYMAKVQEMTCEHEPIIKSYHDMGFIVIELVCIKCRKNLSHREQYWP